MKTASLYKLTFPNSKIYIGISSDFPQRMREHKRNAYTAKLQMPLYNAIRKYGWDNIQKEVIAIGEREYILQAEIRAVAVYQSDGLHGYNLSPGGESGPTPESSRKQAATLRASGKMKEIAKALWQDPAIRERRLLAGNTPECRKAKGADKLGKKDSDETRAKKSASMRGVKKSPEHAAKCRANNIGRIFVTNGVNNRMLKAQDVIPEG